jgi:hypothetical protein
MDEWTDTDGRVDRQADGHRQIDIETYVHTHTCMHKCAHMCMHAHTHIDRTSEAIRVHLERVTCTQHVSQKQTRMK